MNTCNGGGRKGSAKKSAKKSEIKIGIIGMDWGMSCQHEDGHRMRDVLECGKLSLMNTAMVYSGRQ